MTWPLQITSDGIVSIISNVGFPIAAFMLMYRMANQTIKDNTAAITELHTEVKRLRENHGSN